MIEVLLNHRSVRKYKNESISDELLNELFLASCKASTTGNMQVYSIINTTRKEIKELLSPLHFNQKMILNAPNVLTFCADYNRFNMWCKLNNADPGYDNFLSFMTGAIDALLAAQNFAVAAESKGLGICYLGTTIYNADKIIDILNLPKGVVPITTITVGWPDEKTEQVDRLPLDGIVHSEIYQEYDSNKINSIYSHKESLIENIEYVKENNKETLAQVFTDIRYKKSDNEYFSEKLFEVLRKQGFIQ